MLTSRFNVSKYNNRIRNKVNILKAEIIHASMISKEGHIPSAFSIIDLLYIFFHEHKKNNLEDKFILSKGHGVLALYAVLASADLIEKNWSQNFGKFESKFGGHPDVVKVPATCASTGSLGHGLPISIGMAMANKIKKSKGRVFCLIGDGELNEGTFWESSLIARHHNLQNLVVIIDANDSTNRALEIQNLSRLVTSLGWKTISIDGHNFKEILKSFSGLNFRNPTLIIAKTIKGMGLSFMENNPAWHHRVLNNEEMKLALEELG
jgi:transketolase